MGALSPDRPSQRLAPEVVTVWRLMAVATGTALLLAVAGFAVVTGRPWAWLATAAVGALVVVSAAWWPRVSYDHFRWGVDDGVLRIHRGVVFRTQASVPAFRIQHIDLTQGPLDRWFGLRHLVVHTAAPGADLELPGLPADDAPRVRAELFAMARDLGQGLGPGDGTVDAV